MIFLSPRMKFEMHSSFQWRQNEGRVDFPREWCKHRWPGDSWSCARSPQGQDQRSSSSDTAFAKNGGIEWASFVQKSSQGKYHHFSTFQSLHFFLRAIDSKFRTRGFWKSTFTTINIKNKKVSIYQMKKSKYHFILSHSQRNKKS